MTRMTTRLGQVLFNRRMLACLLLGFSSGLPFALLGAPFQIWFRKQGVELAAITLFGWVRFPYSIKFLWAPLLDRYQLPWLSRRRDWALVTQIALVGCIAALALFDPAQSLWPIAVLAFGISFFSASQDIVIDAYRREILADEELGFGNSLAVQAYRVATLIPSSLALFIAEAHGWSAAHLAVAAFMLVGIGASWFAPEVERAEPLPASLAQAIVGPFKEFFGRSDLKSTLQLLAFLALYKFGDSLATSIVSAFYVDLGFSLIEIASFVKVISLGSVIGGSLLGGLVILRIGINRSLWIFGFVQMLSILGFVALAVIGRDLLALGIAIFFEYAGVGLGAAAFVAFIARATNKGFTATQFALFSSFIALPGIAFGSLTGLLVERVGYPTFFLICTGLALPGLLLLPRVAPWSGASSVSHR